MERVWLFSAFSCNPVSNPDPEQIADVQLDNERHALQIAERVWLYEGARRALAEGKDREALASALLGLEIDEATFRPLIDALAARGDPDVLAALAARLGGEMVESASLAAVARRYAAGIPPELSGVDRARGRKVIEGVIGEYVEEVSESALDAAARDRLVLLARSPVIREQFAGWSGLSDGASLFERVDVAIAAGLPEPVAVAEVVEAALASLDPYTKPVWPSVLAGWRAHHAGASTGVGLSLQDLPGAGSFVVGLDVGGPAWRAGVHVGDALRAVDGRAGDTAALSAMLAGEPGSTLRLALVRGEAPLEIELAREEVVEETVRGFLRTSVDGETGWETQPARRVTLIHISAFRPQTDEQLDALLPEDPGAVVLDLRGNSGGDVMAAVNVADRFVAEGPLAHLEGRTIPPPRAGEAGELPWNAAVPGHPLEGIERLVVLIDRNTASAAEIVAGALQERAGAILVGEQTFGKGLSQALRADESLGVGWQVTSGLWKLPSGKLLERTGPRGQQGLAPDVAVPLSPAERLQIEVLRRRRELPPRHPDGTPLPDLGQSARSELPLLSADPQLRQAIAVARDLTARAER